MRGIQESAQVSLSGKDERTRPHSNDPRVHDEQRNLARDPAYDGARRDLRDRLLELLIEQDYPHSPRARVAYGVPRITKSKHRLC